MKFSNSLYFSILASLAAIKVDALVIPNFEDTPAILSEDSNTEAVATTSSDILKDSSSYPEIHLLGDSDSLSVFSKENAIPNSYIIIMKDDVSQDEFDFHKLWISDLQVQSMAKLDISELSEFEDSVNTSNFGSKLGGIGHVYSSPSFRGYSGLFTREVVDMLRRSPEIALIEMDSTVSMISADTQTGAPWGLSRISHREALGLGNYNKYIYDDIAGEGVTAYIIDTGINVNHEQFEGRAVWGATIPSGDEDIDGNGHGTHCAGTIGSKDYGVSKNAKLVAVKVLRSNGSGTMSDVVKGVEFAANAHVAEAKNAKKGFKGSTANMSLGGGKSPALDLAVNAAVKAGLHFAVAAGNDDADACNYSPAAAESAVTVGASTLSDSRAYFSNYGKCVDIFAPGLNILSTYIGSDTSTAVLSGTSMASPHVCGLLTYFLSLQPTSDSLFASSVVTPKQLKDNLIKFGTKKVLSDIPSDGTPNNLIFNGAGKELKDFWNFEDAELANEDDLSRSVKAAQNVASFELESTKEEIIHIVNEVVDVVQKMISV